MNTESTDAEFREELSRLEFSEFHERLERLDRLVAEWSAALRLVGYRNQPSRRSRYLLDALRLAHFVSRRG